MRFESSLSLLLVAVAALSTTTHAFTSPARSASIANRAAAPFGVASAPKPTTTTAIFSIDEKKDDGDDGVVVNVDDDLSSPSPASSWKNSAVAAAAAVVMAATAGDNAALAAGPDWGIFEGRTGSMLHPIMMGSLLLYSGYTAFLGFRYRRQRTIGGEISELKKTLPDLGGASSVSAALETAKAEGGANVAVLEAALSTEQELQALIQERKDISASSPRDQHFSQGALLAFLGTAFAIEGPLNTYARAGKLFPGPHLYVGAALVVIWALAVATIPAMQKGNDTARTIHIGANVTGLGFFVWQVVSGIPIMLKVIEKTSWP